MPRVTRVLLRGGKVLIDDVGVVEASILIEGDRIAKIGPNLSHLTSAVSYQLKGSLVLPGFIDSHLHLEKAGPKLQMVFLDTATTISDVLHLLQEKSYQVSSGTWIQTYDEDCNWSCGALKEKRLPRLVELDSVIPNHPVLVSCGDAAVLNTCGLRKLPIGKLDSESRLAIKALFERQADGIDNPSIISAIKEVLPRPTYEERKAYTIDAMRELNSVGITGVIDPGSGAPVGGPSLYGDCPYEASAKMYRNIVAEGQASVRVKLMARFAREKQVELALELLASRRLPRSDNWIDAKRYFGFGGIKLFADGEIETAWTRDPPGVTGIDRRQRYIDESSLFEVALAAASRGCPIGIHAMGGGAIDLVLQVLEDVNRKIPIAPCRFSIAHAFFPAEDTFCRCHEIELIASLQQPILYSFAPEMIRVWGEEKIQQANPMKTWFDENVHVAAGSDVIPYEPLLSIWSMATRKTQLGIPVGIQEAISVADAIKAYTQGGAYLSHTEKERGSISVGKLADLTILSQNILECPKEEIVDTSVQAVFVGGKLVFQSD